MNEKVAITSSCTKSMLRDVQNEHKVILGDVAPLYMSGEKKTEERVEISAMDVRLDYLIRRPSRRISMEGCVAFFKLFCFICFDKPVLKDSLHAFLREQCV